MSAQRTLLTNSRPAAVPIGRAGLADARVAVLLGAEGPGLTEDALRAADVQLRIPMARGVDSLNVATAGAVAVAALAPPDAGAGADGVGD